MKKAVLLLLLCVFILTHSYSQPFIGKQKITVENSNENLASTLIDVPLDSVSPCNGKRIYLNKGSGDNGIYLNGNSFSYGPGDTLVLRASQNPYSYVTLEYFTKSTDACPLVITNEGGQVLLTNYNGDAIPGGFTFLGSKHIKLTGTGSGDQYGFKVTTPNNRGVGVDVFGLPAFAFGSLKFHA